MKGTNSNDRLGNHTPMHRDQLLTLGDLEDFKSALFDEMKKLLGKLMVTKPNLGYAPVKSESCLVFLPARYKTCASTGHFPSLKLVGSSTTNMK